MLYSMVCKYEDFSKPWYREQENKFRIREIYAGHSARNHDFVNRKFWEWCAIAQALEERNLLVSGSRGLGFAVGTEPLACSSPVEAAPSWRRTWIPANRIPIG